MLITFHGTLAAKITPETHGLPQTYFIFVENRPNGAKKYSECVRIDNSINTDAYQIGDRLKLLLHLSTDRGTQLICRSHPAYLPRRIMDEAEPLYDPLPLNHDAKHNDLMSFTFQAVVSDRMSFFKFSNGALNTVGHNFLVFSQCQLNGSNSSIPIELALGLNPHDNNRGDLLRMIISIRPFNPSIRTRQLRFHYFVDADYPPCLASRAF